MLAFFPNSLKENKLLEPKKLLPFSIKLTNPIQMYQHITDSHACIL